MTLSLCGNNWLFCTVTAFKLSYILVAFPRTVKYFISVVSCFITGHWKETVSDSMSSDSTFPLIISSMAFSEIFSDVSVIIPSSL